ncbi:proton-conducting transporter membrane subunit [Ferrimicrobium acidiphilum]|uniref:proton-conducting transporter transmembrane domain-containing protein n=2 Tax=Ferrimicrobium acidiphilum TaxID=121039 RepID=UPI0023F039A6|nr:proton-conducting transporter membrane subunit [Ferrimicrobium acidiphilum]
MTNDTETSLYRTWLVSCSILTMMIALAGGALAVLALMGHVPSINSAWLLPIAGLHLKIDSISALFDLLTAAIGLPVAAYMGTYFSHHQVPKLTLGLMPTFLTAMLLVPMAATYFNLWFFWEIMALASAALVLTNYRSPQVRKAGLHYIAYTQVGFALILASTAVLNAKSSVGFLNEPSSHVAPLSSLVFVLSLLGFTSKAGLLPLNSWLPLAHPEAPTPVSALMSASMVNLGIYGIVRIDLVNPGHTWWGILMIIIGLSTATYGALHALISADIKRLLAYSTSENLGIVITALGTYELFRSTHFVILAELALAAAILHLIGHVLFKSLAFITSGRLIDEAGTRDIDHMGDMIHRTPLASAGYGIASLGATGLPLGAGFIGEWLLLQALIHTPPSAPTLLRVIMPIAVAILALTVGLKVAAMTKSFGIGVLSRPRDPCTTAINSGRLVIWIDTVIISVLALANLAFSALPSLASPLVRLFAEALLPQGVPTHIGLYITLSPLRGGISPLVIVIVVACATIAVGILVELRIRSNGRVKSGDLWNCGGGEPRIRMQYNSTSFAQPLETIFANVLRLDEQTAASHADEDRLIVAAIVYERSRTDIVATMLHRFVGDSLDQCSRLVRRAHAGNVRLYTLYGAIGLLIILLVAR